MPGGRRVRTFEYDDDVEEDGRCPRAMTPWAPVPAAGRSSPRPLPRARVCR